jgi:hypothetical protein
MHDSHPNSKSGTPIIFGDKGGVLDYCTGERLRGHISTFNNLITCFSLFSNERSVFRRF